MKNVQQSVFSRNFWLTMLLASCMGGAQATPLTWTLSGVTFDDGATATGSFVFDADTRVYTGWSITTSASTRQGFATPHSYSYNNLNTDLFVNRIANQQGAIFKMPGMSFGMNFQSMLTNNGGTSLLLPGIRGFEFAGSSFSRGISGGSIISSVPEPMTTTLMLAGLGILGFVARRRRSMS